MTVKDAEISDEIMRQVAAARSVAPRDVATSLATEGPWQKLLPKVRTEAVKLEAAGKLVFVRKRKIVSSDGLRGVYRLASPERWSQLQPAPEEGASDQDD